MKDRAEVRDSLGRYKAADLILRELSCRAGRRFDMRNVDFQIVEDIYRNVKSGIYDKYRELIAAKAKLLSERPTVERDRKLKALNEKCAKYEEGFGMRPEEFLKSFAKIVAAMEVGS